MKIVKKPLSELRPVERNVRRHSPKQITEYMRSLRMFGQLRPLVVDEEGVIWIGNGMFEAMRALGWEEAECDVKAGLTEAQKNKMMMADNRIYELGMTDTDAFDQIVRSLEGDVDIPGWDADLLETLNASVAQVDAMVGGYGAYPPVDMGRYGQREPATQPETPLQRSDFAPEQNAQGETYPENEAAETGLQAQETRSVICPHCGAVIPIGGA